MEEHGHYTYENETAADARSYACEWEDTPQGNRVTGVIGAMLGAMIGAIPWFIASTFTSNFIGWLGFLTGIAACYGYRLFRGRRSTRFAMTVIVISSILVLFAAEIASWMYVLCSDPDWQKDAALIGIPVARLAWESIRMPDNWHIMAPNMLIGMTIGLLGVVSARRRVLAYTDPDRAVRTAYTTAASQTAQANEAAGFAVPQGQDNAADYRGDVYTRFPCPFDWERNGIRGSGTGWGKCGCACCLLSGPALRRHLPPVSGAEKDGGGGQRHPLQARIWQSAHLSNLGDCRNAQQIQQPAADWPGWSGTGAL